MQDTEIAIATNGFLCMDSPYFRVRAYDYLMEFFDDSQIVSPLVEKLFQQNFRPRPGLSDIGVLFECARQEANFWLETNHKDTNGTYWSDR